MAFCVACGRSDPRVTPRKPLCYTCYRRQANSPAAEDQRYARERYGRNAPYRGAMYDEFGERRKDDY